MYKRVARLKMKKKKNDESETAKCEQISNFINFNP